MASTDPPSFLEPSRLVNTALGITVGIAWNNAVREGVDDFVGKNVADNALITAVLITLVVLVMYFLMNKGHSLVNSFSSPPSKNSSPSESGWSE